MFTTHTDERLGASAVTSHEHRVTAVLVARNGRRWLPRTLAALAAADRRPDVVVAVDCGSVDDSAGLLRGSPVVDQVAEVPAATGIGAAIAAGLAAAGDAVIDLTDRARSAVPWIWVLHDDSAPAPDALSQLLDRSDHYPDAQILGPKIRGWSRPEVLRECGISLTAGGRQERHVLPGERDQGQRDGVIGAMAVSSTGMLVRADLWDRLGGFDPNLPVHGADTNFCERAARLGAQVVVAPRAVIYHRGASAAGLRGGDDSRRAGRYALRRAVAYDRLVQASTWRLPWLVLWLVLAAAGRAVAGLLALAPRRAAQDAAGTWAAVLSVGKWSRARRDLASRSVVAAGALRPARPTIAQQLLHYRDTVSWTLGGTDAAAGAASGLRWTLAALALVVLPLAAASLLATGYLWFGPGRISGGALLPAPDSAADLLHTFGSAWHEVGLGSSVPSPPYLVVVAAAAAVLLGSATTAVQIAVLLGPALAGLAAVVCLRGFVGRGAAVAVGVAYGMLPAVVAATGTGRLGTALAAVALPPFLRSLARCSGAVAHLPHRGWASTAWTAVMGAVLAAAVPLLAVVLFVVGIFVVAAVGGFRPAGRVLLAAAFAGALLWPWSGYVVGDPGLLLLEVGAHPGALLKPAATPAELVAMVPGGPAVPPPLAVLLLIPALAALVPQRTRPAAVVGWLLFAVGLGMAVVLRTVAADVPWSAQDVGAWPGPATLVMGAGALIAVAALGSGAGAGSPTRWAPVAALLVPLLVAVATAGWWVWERDSLLQRQEPFNISAYVTSQTTGPAAPRSLALSGDAERRVSYRLLSGPGARLGDADVAPPASSMAHIDAAVARLVSGGAGQPLEVLADAAVQYVAVDVRSDRDLARRLDAAAGLQRMSTVDGVTLWRMVATRPRVAAATGNAASTGLATAAVAPALAVDTGLPPGTVAIRVAEHDGGLWRAMLDGVDMDPVGDPGSVAGEYRAAVPAGAGGQLVVGIDGSSRAMSLLVPLGAALALLVGVLHGLLPAAPRRARRRTPSRLDLRDSGRVGDGAADRDESTATGARL